jgi:hypothetical protein
VTFLKVMAADPDEELRALDSHFREPPTAGTALPAAVRSSGSQEVRR